MVHGIHEGKPGYHPDQILFDGCAECEERGRNIPAALNAMDKGRFERAWVRAATWNREGLSNVSEAEAGLLHVLWLIQIKLETRGVPIGTVPRASVSYEIPADSDHPATLEEVIYQAIGHASMCWKPRPAGIFDSDEASRVGAELVRAMRARGAR